jgi:hypothetical protein
MPSLQDVIERACADGAFEVIIESGHSAVIASPTGKVNTGLPISEDDIHGMLDRYMSPDQHVELAMGDPVSFDLPLRGEKGSWRVVVQSLPEGSIVRVTAPARPRSTGEFSATDLRKMMGNREPAGPGTGGMRARSEPPRSLLGNRNVSAAVNDEIDLDLDFDAPPLHAALASKYEEAPRRAPAANDDDFAFDEMQMGSTPAPSLESLGPLDGEEEFRRQLLNDAPDYENANAGLARSNDEDLNWDEDEGDENEDEEFSVPGVGPHLGHVQELDFGETPMDGLANPGWTDAPIERVASAGVPAYIPETEGYTPHSGLDFEEEDRVAQRHRNSPTIEFDLGPSPSEPATSSALDDFLRPSTLVIALEEHVAGLVSAGLSLPSIVVDHHSFEPNELAPRLARLPRGSCIVLDLEDPSVALAWMLRRLEQGFRVVIVARAVTIEGAQRMIVGMHYGEAARHWLCAHETFGVSFEKGALAWRALAWRAELRAA